MAEGDRYLARIGVVLVSTRYGLREQTRAESFDFARDGSTPTSVESDGLRIPSDDLESGLVPLPAGRSMSHLEMWGKHPYDLLRIVTSSYSTGSSTKRSAMR
jgi:hypothetical protein